MKQRRTVKALLAAILTLALAFATVTPAFAGQQGNNNPEEPGAIVSDTVGEDVQVVITKVIRTGETTIIPKSDFKFKFKQIKNETKDYTGQTIQTRSDTVNIPDVTINIPNNMAGTDDFTNREKIAEKESGNIFNGVTFPRAGVYVFEVREEKSGWNSGNETRQYTETIDGVLYKVTETMTWSKAMYKMYVYVANDGEGGLYIKAVSTIYQEDNDGLTATTGSQDENIGKKVNPTPKNRRDDGQNGEMKFRNDFERNRFSETIPKKNAIAIEKVVTGDYSDMTQAFNFTVTLKRIAVDDATEYVGTIYEGDSAVDTKTFTFDNDGIAQDTVALKHGQVLAFPDAPVGTHFQAKEVLPANQGWQKPTIEVKVNNAKVTTGVSANNNGADSGEKIVGEKPENSVTVTNSQKDITPTGIILNNLPFIVMIGAAVAAIVALAVVKAKKNAVNE